MPLEVSTPACVSIVFMLSCMAMMSALISNPATEASAMVHKSSAAADRIITRMSVRFISTCALMQEP